MAREEKQSSGVAKSREVDLSHTQQPRLQKQNIPHVDDTALVSAISASLFEVIACRQYIYSYEDSRSGPVFGSNWVDH